MARSCRCSPVWSELSSSRSSAGPAWDPSASTRGRIWRATTSATTPGRADRRRQHHPVRTGAAPDGSVTPFPDLLDRGPRVFMITTLSTRRPVAQPSNRLAAVDGRRNDPWGKIAGQCHVTWRCFVLQMARCVRMRSCPIASAVDASFLPEVDTTPMHVGGVAIFRSQRSGLTTTRSSPHRSAAQPGALPAAGCRFRAGWPARCGSTTRLRSTYHVRRSALPRPGNDEQLHELAARLMSRKPDQSRPLWRSPAEGCPAIAPRHHQNPRP